jgi:bifunctional DNA-binding transcriptional regulator/antitoxin component of YhaV-PrlF toxin-antitoxin module
MRKRERKKVRRAMSTYEFTATITAAGQIEVPNEVAEKLPAGKRAQVKVTVGEAKPISRGTPGKDAVKLAGLIPPEDLEEIRKAIEEDCETIDENEW